MASCVDTVLLPDDKTVDEDFWQSKSDVSMMVNGAYSKMTGADVISKLIVWGGFRSDELLLVSNINDGTRNSLLEIEEVNIETTNAFSAWAPIYSVINNCNIVLQKAEPVMSIDPNYTNGDYETDRSQMLALRALCYFYLVRTFRDVPYTTTAYMNSSQDMTIRQLSPDSVLVNCIADLEEAEKNALSAAASGWQRVGWINKEAIHSILADIYLWRASVMHNPEDYKKCVEYCDKVIESKRANHVQGPMETVVKEYPLYDAGEAYNEIFINMNSEESIFELQSGNNSGLCSYYFKYKDNNSTTGYLQASSIFGATGTSNVYASGNDFRYWMNTFDVGSGAASFDVRKMIGQNMYTALPTKGIAREARQYGNFRQNFIIYRLTDIMLMKAEAMTQLAADKADPILRSAFNIVQYVNNRSYDDAAKSDSLKWNTYADVQRMEELILAERLRELCFEGKRWYDLLRYNYRHVEGVDYTTTLADMEAAGTPLPKNHNAMLDLIGRKYTEGAAARKAKMRSEANLYMPIPRTDTDVCDWLKQNPAYSDNDQFTQND